MHEAYSGYLDYLLVIGYMYMNMIRVEVINYSMVVANILDIFCFKNISL